MDLSPYYELLVLLHVVGVLVFLVTHSVSAIALWKVRTERDLPTIRKWLERSRRSLVLMNIGLATWAIAGVLSAFAGGWWTSGQYWVWAALVVAIIVIGAMTPMGRFYLNRLRSAAGTDPKRGSIDDPVAVDSTAFDVALATGRPVTLAAIGIVGLVILFWLMLFKPF
jgi:hypothetical protein